jgi:pimeloyl-ACP methyl ester carboxylesterase
MAAITDLYFKAAVPTNKGTNLPILAFMHGWNQAASRAPEVDILRIANFGFCVLSIGMRGRDEAEGTIDASAREIYDIIDAVDYVRTHAPYSHWVSQTKAAIVGYSGGGGNALAAACKFPDFFTVAISHFGMSDLGRNNPDGWYYNNGAGSYTASIATRVGGVPGDVPNNYYARDATAAIQNFTGGYLYLYHDKGDAAVPWVHSDRIKAAMDAAGLTNYSANFSETTDALRWTHGYPSDHPGTLSTAEATWAAKIHELEPWTIPATGTVTVIGYIVTKRFSIWLNSGLDAAATVVYDTSAGTYTVTPLTSADVTVAITQGALTASGTAPAGGPTLFTVS